MLFRQRGDSANSAILTTSTIKRMIARVDYLWSFTEDAIYARLAFALTRIGLRLHDANGLSEFSKNRASANDVTQ